MIKIKDVSLRYGDSLVQRDLNWELGEGEVGLITGPTGSGKTSLLYSILGIAGDYVDLSYEGKISVFGMEPKEALKKHLSYYVPQEPENSFLGFNVCAELTWRTSSFDLFKKAVEKFGLEGLLNRDVTKLSGGEAQRVSLAFGFINGYKLLLLDEPLANLDQESRRAFVEMLKILREEKVTVIISEHRKEFLENVADSKLELEKKEKGPLPKEAPRLSDKAKGTAYVSAKGLSYTYEDGHQALSNVTFNVDPGEVVSFVGPNGSGKSTLAKIISGLINHKEKIVFAKSVGFTLQTPELQFLNDSVYSEVNYEAKGRALAEESLRFFRLDDKLARLPHSLSRGERVRLALASAVAKDAELYVFDEPTEGQDELGLEMIKLVLKEIKSSGSSAILITQEEGFAKSVSDRIYRFNKGVVYAQ